MGVEIGDIFRLMPKRKQRQHRPGDDAEIGGGREAFCEFFGPPHMIPDHVAQSLQPAGAQQEPDFQRAEAAAERHAPFRVIDDAVPVMRLEKFGMNGERPEQAIGLAQKVSGAVEIRAEPFVRIEHDGVGVLDAVPEMPEFRTDHRRSRRPTDLMLRGAPLS